MISGFFHFVSLVYMYLMYFKEDIYDVHIFHMRPASASNGISL